VSIEPKNYYLTDTPESLYNEIKLIEIEIERVGKAISDWAKKEQKAYSDYVENKSTEILALRTSEAEARRELHASDPKATYKGMTDMQREAHYRIKFKKDRRDWQEAKIEREGLREYREALGNVISAKKERFDLLRQERFAAGRAELHMQPKVPESQYDGTVTRRQPPTDDCPF
jgi:hypothetical protein